MIIVTQSQLRNKDTEAIILLRNEIKASFNTNTIDYFTISAVAEILYNKFKHILSSTNNRPGLKVCSSSIHDGKTQRRERRAKAIRRRKGRL